MTDFKADCQICGINMAKYFCPRCNIPYCSVPCYQSQTHLQCSENFYEKWVKEELKNCHSDPEVQRKILEILKQNQEVDSENLDSDDDESDTDLSTRMADVNLDDEEAVWEKLTPEERKNFKKLVANGNIIKLLPEWEPWWKTKKRKTFIQECEEDNFDWKSLCPAIPNDIPKLFTLIKSQPSQNIIFMVLNVIASYVFTVRWFKGCHKDMPVESISTVIALSSVLRKNEVFENPVIAFVSFENDLAKCEWLKQEKYDKNTIQEDLMIIINGGYGNDLHCVKAAISDLKSLCTQAMVIIKNSKTHHLKRFSGSPPKVNLLQQISKKLNFYLSWTVDYGHILINMHFSSNV